MGNSSGRESRFSGENTRSPTTAHTAHFSSHSGDAQLARANRHDVSFFSLASGTAAGPAQEVRKETRQEREARKLEKERVLRLKERERSLRDEGVDGGYLVTLGTYTGPEDFSKTAVRQLMIERKIAPFWRGLNDHSDSWTENQLVAAARGKPIPAPDEIPEDENLSPITTNIIHASHPGAMAVPGSGKAQESALLSASHPVSSTGGLFPSPSGQPSTSTPLFRGRAKTLASLASASKNPSQTELVPQEVQSPPDPYINGMRIEAHLYKDVLECPICFMYYPPYLNRTRCCDQPICSECFVQIKRPEPHPPEHLDPNTPVPEGPPRPEEGSQLVSEPATCPFCVREEFGVTYQPPSFRRGLIYVGHGPRLAKTGSAMSSASDLSGVSTPIGSPPPPTFNRRRTESLSANAPGVITTDKVRPDWAKKLSDARANQTRRSAAATALHTAAYLMGNTQGSSSANPFSRRRRAETTGSNGPTGHAGTDIEQLMAALEARRGGAGALPGGSDDLWPPRGSSQRATTAHDIEEIMLMEAIRLSLAAEEDRKKKEEKEAAKQAKKDDKQTAKDQKKADKVAKKSGLYSSSANSSALLSHDGSIGSPAAGASSVHLNETHADNGTVDGKGKARVPSTTQAMVGVVPLAEPTSTVNMEVVDTTREGAQQHLEDSRAQIITGSASAQSGLGNRLRGGSNASHASTASTASLNGSGLPHVARPDDGEATPSSSLEPVFNLSSLAEVIGKQAGEGGTERVGHSTGAALQDADAATLSK